MYLFIAKCTDTNIPLYPRFLNQITSVIKRNQSWCVSTTLLNRQIQVATHQPGIVTVWQDSSGRVLPTRAPRGLQKSDHFFGGDTNKVRLCRIDFGVFVIDGEC